MNANLLTTSFNINDQYLVRFLNDNLQPDEAISNGEITLSKGKFDFKPVEGSIEDFDADLQFLDGEVVLSTDKLVFSGEVKALKGEELLGDISFTGKVKNAEIHIKVTDVEESKF